MYGSEKPEIHHESFITIANYICVTDIYFEPKTCDHIL